MPQEHVNTIILHGEIEAITEPKRVQEGTLVMLRLRSDHEFAGPQVHRVVAWNEHAERLAQGCKVHDSIAITGAIRTTSYRRERSNATPFIEVTDGPHTHHRADPSRPSVGISAGHGAHTNRQRLWMDNPRGYLENDNDVRLVGVVRSSEKTSATGFHRLTVETLAGRSDIHDLTHSFKTEPPPRVGDTITIHGRLAYEHSEGWDGKVQKHSFLECFEEVRVLERAPERQPGRPPLLTRLLRRGGLERGN